MISDRLLPPNEHTPHNPVFDGSITLSTHEQLTLQVEIYRFILYNTKLVWFIDFTVDTTYDYDMPEAILWITAIRLIYLQQIFR